MNYKNSISLFLEGYPDPVQQAMVLRDIIETMKTYQTTFVSFTERERSLLREYGC
jgi:hypothetical protein